MTEATATVAVQVPAPPEVAFDLFTREVDLWWRRGRKFRHGDGVITIAPGVGGRVYERWRDDQGDREFELGRVTAWQPGVRLQFTWRNATFTPLQDTEVEVTFAAIGSGTLVTVRHRGWDSLPDDHPAKHGMDHAAFARSVGLWWGEQMTALREFARRR